MFQSDSSTPRRRRQPPQAATSTPGNVSSPSPEQLWELVLAHTPVIEELVDAARARGTCTKDREDAIADATMQAFELVQRYDPARGPFENQLRYVLFRKLENPNFHSTDALDYSGVDLEELAPVQVAVEAEVEATPIDLTARIAQLPSRYQALARYAYVEHRPLWSIAKKTGLHRYWLKRRLSTIARLLSQG